MYARLKTNDCYVKSSCTRRLLARHFVLCTAYATQQGFHSKIAQFSIFTPAGTATVIILDWRDADVDISLAVSIRSRSCSGRCAISLGDAWFGRPNVRTAQSAPIPLTVVLKRPIVVSGSHSRAKTTMKAQHRRGPTMTNSLSLDFHLFAIVYGRGGFVGNDFGWARC